MIEIHGKYASAKLHNKNGYVALVSSRHLNYETEIYLKNNRFSQIISLSSSVKLCMIAEGAGDVYPKFSETMEWDIAAGHAIIKAAGGDVCNRSGESIIYAKQDFLNSHFIATNRKWSSRLL